MIDVAMNAWESDIVPCKKCINCDYKAEKNKDCTKNYIWRSQRFNEISAIS